MGKESILPTIKQEFTNEHGKLYDKVREIAFEEGKLCGNLGTFITETDRNSRRLFHNPYPVYIYQTYTDPHTAYRIYQDLYDPGFNGNNDDILIQKLQERQDKIKLSKFPTGVVTLGGHIIGQEIPFYQNDVTLLQFFQNNKNVNPTKVYYATLEILNEMYSNGILYIDNHPRNFMVDPSGNIDVIDFDNTLIKFDNYDKVSIEQLFRNFSLMVNWINKICEIDSEVGYVKGITTFEEAYKQIDTMKKKLVR